jgi:hypothetical protein
MRCALADYAGQETSPERQLAAAMLLQAIKDALGVGNTTIKQIEQAASWLRRGEADWICDLLQLSRRKVRRAATDPNSLMIVNRRIR